MEPNTTQRSEFSELGQVRVQLALLTQKLDTFIEEERQWRLSYNMRLDKMDDRMNLMRADVSQLDIKRAASEEEHKSIWGAIGDLKYSVRAWDMVNTIGVVGSIVAAVILRK